MVQEADALVGYDTYPHIDLYETGAKAASLILRAVRGEVRPVTLFARAPMLVPAEGQGTSNQPMAGLMAEAKRLQARPGVLPSPCSRSSRGSTSPTPGSRSWPSPTDPGAPRRSSR